MRTSLVGMSALVGVGVTGANLVTSLVFGLAGVAALMGAAMVLCGLIAIKEQRT